MVGVNFIKKGIYGIITMTKKKKKKFLNIIPKKVKPVCSNCKRVTKYNLNTKDNTRQCIDCGLIE